MSSNLKEITADLFSAPKEHSLAHCVASDFKMGKGIAIKFRDYFGRIQELKSQNVSAGGLAVLKDENRYIYYLITKQYTHQKPTYQSMYSSLNALRDHMKKNNVKNLAIPRIGCGLDGLEWRKVKDQVNEVFQNDEDIEITVYNYSAKN